MVLPYGYGVGIGQDHTQLFLLLSAKKLRRIVPVDLQLVLPPSTTKETVTTMTRIKVAIPDDLPEKTYDMGFAISRTPLSFWYNSPRHNLEIRTEK